MLRVYRERIAGPPPTFPADMERRITRYLQRDVPAAVVSEGVTHEVIARHERE